MLDPVEIFVQAVEDEGEELLGVVLVCAGKLRGKCYDIFLSKSAVFFVWMSQKRSCIVELTRNVTGERNV